MKSHPFLRSLTYLVLFTFPLFFILEKNVNGFQGIPEFYIDEPPSQGSLTDFSLPQVIVANRPLSSAEAVDAALSYLTQNPKKIGNLDVSRLKLIYTNQIPLTAQKPGMIYVQFIEQWNNKDVAGTSVHATFKVLANKTVLMSLKTHLYPAVSIYPYPSTSTTPNTKQRAEQALNLPSGGCTLKSLTPAVQYLGGLWREVEKISCQERPYTVTVDIHTMNVWFLGDHVKADALTSGSVSGQGIAVNPSTANPPLETLFLKYLKLKISPIEIFTDINANFAIPSNLLPADVTAGLSGLYVTVSDFLKHNLVLTQNVKAGDKPLFLFNPTNTEEPTAQVNGYYFTTLTHDWLRERLPDPHKSDIDYAMPVEVNITQETGPQGEIIPAECNAYFDNVKGTGIHFYHSGEHCINMAFRSVISHEMGHYADAIFGGIDVHDQESYSKAGGLSEGWGDTLAAFVYSDPIIGTTNPAIGFFRTADNTYQFPPSGVEDDPHTLGQAWAGFAWDLRRELIARYGETIGMRKAEDLIFSTLIANASTIPDALMEVLLWDDDDANLSNGSPNLTEILKAAAGHSIPIPFALRITSPQTGFATVGGDPISIKATIPQWIIDISKGSYRLFYQKVPKNGDPLPEKVALTSPGNRPLEDEQIGLWSTPANLEPGNYRIIFELNFADGGSLNSVIEVVFLENLPGRITSTLSIDEKSPDIDGDWLSWFETDDNQGYEVVAYHLTTGERISVFRDDFGPQISSTSGFPRIEYPWVVWDNSYKIYAYNLENKTLLQLNRPGLLQLYPAIHNQKVVWVDRSRNADKVWIYDLKTSQSYELPNQSSQDKDFAEINGDYVAWVENKEIFLDHLTDGVPAPVQITQDKKYKNWISIYGNKVAWIGGGSLYLYDIPSQQTRILIDSSTSKLRIISYTTLDMSDQLIVFAAINPGASYEDIFVYDLQNNQVTSITDHPAIQENPRLSGNRIVFEDYRDDEHANDSNIFVYNYEQPSFIRGDADNNQQVDISDPIFILQYLFRQGSPPPPCLDSADVNDDGEVDISDAVYDLLYLFGGKKPPSPPSPTPGIDPTPDSLGCRSK